MKKSRCLKMQFDLFVVLLELEILRLLLYFIQRFLRFKSHLLFLPIFLWSNLHLYFQFKLRHFNLNLLIIFHFLFLLVILKYYYRLLAFKLFGSKNFLHSYFPNLHFSLNSYFLLLFLLFVFDIDCYLLSLTIEQLVNQYFKHH